MKEQISKITGNPVGAIVGAGAFYFGAKKFANIENKWALIALAVGGAVVGAMVQSKIKAKASMPTAATAAPVKK